MTGAATARERKPAKREGEQLRCFCNRAQGECECAVFQPRPCTCGHPHSLHLARCKGATSEGKCECRRYEQDSTPEFLLRAGINAGNWQFTPIHTWLALMRPEFSVRVRIYACLVVHAMERRNRSPKRRNGRIVPRNQARLAIYLIDDKAGRPLLPDDIVKELNAMDPIARLTKENIRPELRGLETCGLIRQFGKVRRNIRLFVYLRPLSRRKIAPEARKFGSEISLPNMGNSNNPEEIRGAVMHASILQVKASFVKTTTGGVRKLIASHPDLVVHPHYQTAIEEAAEQVALVVTQLYQTLGLVVKTDGAYKEDSTSSNKEHKRAAAAPNGASITEQETASPPEAKAPPPLPDSDSNQNGNGSSPEPDPWQPVKAWIHARDRSATDRQVCIFIEKCRAARFGIKPEVVLAAIEYRHSTIQNPPNSMYAVLSRDVIDFLKGEIVFKAWQEDGMPFKAPSSQAVANKSLIQRLAAGARGNGSKT